MLEELEEPYLSTKEWVVIALVILLLLPIAIPVIAVAWILEKIGVISDEKAK